MTSRSNTLQPSALALSMTMVALFLSMIMPGSASAAPCADANDPNFPRIVNNGTLTLHDCEISGGSTAGDGGGVENHGDLTLINVTISGNSAGGNGGGIFNDSKLTLDNVTVIGNSSSGLGGGIDNHGDLTATNVTVVGNSAGDNGGGIYSNATLALENASVSSNNTSSGLGGGLHNDGGTVSMVNVTVRDNTAFAGGGGIANVLGGTTVGASLAVANNTTTTGDGGGILNDGSSFCLTSEATFNQCFVPGGTEGGGNSLVTGNHATAGHGGGIANNFSALDMTDSTVNGNQAGGDGGGIWNEFSTVVAANVTISNNNASGNGGGASVDVGSLLDGINVTIAQNGAGGNGGGVYTANIGGTSLGSATIADNAASGSGGGVYNDDGTGATTELLNTLLARNGANCAGTIGEPVSPSTNLDTGNTCVFAGGGDQTNVGDGNVGLLTLAANGGPTQGSTEVSAPMMTQALIPTSPAVDTAGATCPSFATDERGVLRPQDGNQDGTTACDIGAFELTPCLTLEKSCATAQPPYVCTKPITSLTMKWDGTGVSPSTGDCIRIAGTAGSTPFDIDGICVGDVITVSGYDGSQGNDVLWNICAANSTGACASGNPAFIGQSSFHLSCSDVDMNSADDCGKIEGDNKGSTSCLPGNNNASCIDRWIFEGMTGPAGSTPLVCGEVAGQTECNVSPLGYLCTKPITSLTMQLSPTSTLSPTTGNCVRIAGTAGANPATPFDIPSVCPGQTVTVAGYNGNQGNDVLWNICAANSGGACASGNPAFIGQSSFHLSCSDVDMNSADDCGKLEGNNKGNVNCLPGNNNASCINEWIFEGMTGPPNAPSSASLDCASPNGTAPVGYHYVVTNLRPTPVTGVSVTDDVTDSSGTTTVPVCGPFDLAPGEQHACDLVDNIGELTTNIATASNGGDCSASSDTVTVTANPGPTACPVGAATLTIGDRDVKWKLTAPKIQAVEIKEIDIAFPVANGVLQEVHLAAPRIFKGSVTSPATIIAFSGKPKDRTIERGKTEELKFHFQKSKIGKSGYDITVTFTNGCSVHIAN